VKTLIALLGRRSTPTDGIEDYCTWLGRGLAERGHRLRQVRVPWNDTGWPGSLWWLWRESAGWRGEWVLVQYTAMSWSGRGLPLRFLAVLVILRLRSCRIAVVFHDPSGFPGRRWIDRMRRTCQHWVMRRAYRWAERAILNVPVDRVGWLPPNSAKAVCIPVGSNVPAAVREHAGVDEQKAKTVVVFCVTEGEHGRREAAQIARAVHRAAVRVPRPSLVVLGRGSKEAAGALQRAVNGANVELSVLGVLPAEDISRVIAQADVLLFVRGSLSSQRGSGIAAIACGLPIVGYAGPETGPPLTEAGALLVPQGSEVALAEALTRVLLDRDLWRRLHERSVEAYGRYFSWEAIADRFVETLQL
jgi:glycosyltransferase involved in cell wall biosynthesis